MAIDPSTLGAISLGLAIAGTLYRFARESGKTTEQVAGLRDDMKEREIRHAETAAAQLKKLCEVEERTIQISTTTHTFLGKTGVIDVRLDEHRRRLDEHHKRLDEHGTRISEFAEDRRKGVRRADDEAVE